MLIRRLEFSAPFDWDDRAHVQKRLRYLARQGTAFPRVNGDRESIISGLQVQWKLSSTCLRNSIISVSKRLLLLLLLFLTFSVLVANPKKLLYTVANPARGLLNREKRTKEKVWQHTPPPHPPHCSFGENK